MQQKMEKKRQVKEILDSQIKEKKKQQNLEIQDKKAFETTLLMKNAQDREKEMEKQNLKK